MRVHELLEVLDENRTIVLIDETMNVLKDGIYDGSNSIDSKYNYKTINFITTRNNEIVVQII